MLIDDIASLSRRNRIRLALLLVIVIALVIWGVALIAQTGPARRFVLASGPESGVYHRYAQRYVEILAREGVKVEERMTEGAVDNLRLLLDPKSGVGVALLQAGIATSPASDSLVMLASLYYEPLWIFYRGSETLSQINHLHGKRMAVGTPGSGTRAFVVQMLAANGLMLDKDIARDNTELVPIGGGEALAALKAREVDAALFVGAAQTPAIQAALRDPAIKLMSLSRAAAYPRIFPHITRLTLPPGTIDLGINVPEHEVDPTGVLYRLTDAEPVASGVK